MPRRTIRGRDPEAQYYAGIRKRARREVQKLRALYKSMSAEERAGETGRGILQHQEQIEDLSKRTYLGRKASKDTRREARMASNELQGYLGREGERGRRATQERLNRIYRQQIRTEERGGESAMYGGRAGSYHLERIFYMATESAWSGLSNEDRDQAIMDALGVSSLRDAYDIIMGSNLEAIAAMADLDLKGEGLYMIGSDEIAAYIEDIYDIIADRA